MFMSLLSFLLSIKRLEESPHVPFLISLYAFYIAAFFEVYLLAMVFGSNGVSSPCKQGVEDDITVSVLIESVSVLIECCVCLSESFF
jgi:hypothetical protein